MANGRRRAGRRKRIEPHRPPSVERRPQHRHLRSAAPATSEIVDFAEERRFRRACEQLHALGPRATYELLVEIGARRFCRSELEELVGAYVQRLTPLIPILRSMMEVDL